MTADDLLLFVAPPDPAGPLTTTGVLLLGATLAICAAIAVVDARERIIPDGCNGLLAALGLAFAAGRDGAPAMLPAALQGTVAFLAFWSVRGLYRVLRGEHGLGLGDVKFLGACGIWVGLGALPALILVACGTALGFLGLNHLRGQAVTAGSALPFGPFLVLGFLGVLAAALGG